MPDNRSVARSTAVIGLMLLATVALRGYLPGADAAPRPAERTPGGLGTMVAVVAMLAVSTTVIAVSILTQSRRRTPRGAGPERPRPRDRGPGGIRWRWVLVIAAGLAVWLVVVLMLMRWGPVWAPAGDVGTGMPESGSPEDSGGAETGVPDGRGTGPDMFGYLAVATAVLIGCAAIATVLGRRRTPTWTELPVETDSAGTSVSTEPDLARAAERGLAEIGDPARDPREAIIACYAAMEHELEKTPASVPQASDTPSEVLARAVSSRTLRADSAHQLVDLFEEARFSPHVMHEGHRAEAIRALRLVQQDLAAVP